MAEDERKICWTDALEDFFTTIGSKSNCYAWLHKRSESMFSQRVVFIDIPIVVIGTLNGAISVGSRSLFGEAEYAPILIGMVALLTSILNTISSYFAWARRAESHRMSAINYSKLYRFLVVELSLPRKERMDADSLLKFVKTEYDRLAETSPLIPPQVVSEFHKRFKDDMTISKPDEVNGISSLHTFKHTEENIVVRPEEATEATEEAT